MLKMSPLPGSPSPLAQKSYPLEIISPNSKTHVSLSEITNEDALINFFSREIPVPLMKRIYAMDTIHTTIDDWYKCAIHFKTQWDKANAISHKHPYNPYPAQKSHTQNHQTQPKVDPYAMDINSTHLEKLITRERERCQRENLCLWCRKPGQYENNCPMFPNWDNTPRNTPKPPFQKKAQPEPKKIAKIEEEEIEEVMEEEECIAKISTQEF